MAFWQSEKDFLQSMKKEGKGRGQNLHRQKRFNYAKSWLSCWQATFMEF